MAGTPLDRLGALQRRVVEILWDRGEGTVHDVRDAIAGEDRSPAYTTILSVLQKLEKAGWVGHRREGRTYVYAPCRTREEERASSLRRLLDRVFGGDPVRLMQHLIDDEEIGEEELAALRKLIDDRREGGAA